MQVKKLEECCVRFANENPTDLDRGKEACEYIWKKNNTQISRVETEQKIRLD